MIGLMFPWLSGEIVTIELYSCIAQVPLRGSPLFRNMDQVSVVKPVPCQKRLELLPLM